MALQEGQSAGGTDEAGNTYAVFDNQWISYDSPTVVTEKVSYNINHANRKCSSKEKTKYYRNLHGFFVAARNISNNNILFLDEVCNQFWISWCCSMGYRYG